MDLNMNRPKNETEDLLLSLTKNCEKLNKQIHRKPEETLKIRMTKSKETFHFNRSLPIGGSWMIGLPDLDVFISLFNLHTTNNKFKVHKFPDSKLGNFSSEKVKDEIEKELDISGITDADSQDEITASIPFEKYREQVTKRMIDDENQNTLVRYTSSKFQGFESFLRVEVDLVEDDIRLVSDEYNPSFTTYDLQPGIYTFKGNSEALLKILQSDFEGYHNTINIG